MLLDKPEDAVSVAARVFGASAWSVLESRVVDQPAEKEIETNEYKEPEEELLLEIIHVGHPILVLDDGHPFGHGKTEAAEGSVFASRILQQAYADEESDPVEKESDHERAQKHAFASDLLVQLVSGHWRVRSLSDRSKVRRIDGDDRWRIC